MLVVDMLVALFSVLDWDIQVFHFINNSLSNPFFDVFLTWIRNPLIWAPFYVFIISFLFVNLPRRSAFILVGFLGMTALCTDFVSSTVIKKTVKRIRPCNDSNVYPQAKVLIRCGSGYSFTSSHAANHFGLASFIFLAMGGMSKWFRWPLVLWAGTISFAQIYVGVHYPIDIFAGAILGILIGRLIYFVYQGLYDIKLSNEETDT